MDKKVLIAFASKHGATGEIAARIDCALHATGAATDLRSAEDVDDLAAYDAFVIGSAVYAGQWRKEAAELSNPASRRYQASPFGSFQAARRVKGIQRL